MQKPYFITAAGLTKYQELEAQAIEGKFADTSLLDLVVKRRPPMFIDTNGIATIYAEGPMGNNLTGMEKLLGKSDYKDISADFANALANNARGILFVVNSPGGDCEGCSECGEIIQRVNEIIPVVTFTEGDLCSAAYYLAAPSSSIMATNSSSVGSVGTLIRFLNTSKMLELQGITLERFTSGDLKGISSEAGLSDPQREYLAEMVNDLSQEFFNHVSENRLVEDEIYRAGHYTGKKSLELGLIDKIGSLQDAYDTLLDLAA